MPETDLADPTADDAFLRAMREASVAVADHVRQAATTGTGLTLDSPGVVLSPLIRPMPGRPAPLVAPAVPRVVAPGTAPASAPPPSATRPRRARRQLVGAGLLTFGGIVIAFAVYLFGLSGLQHDRDQASLQRDLREQIANAQAPIGGSIAEGEPVALLQIPAIGLEAAVIEGSDAADLKRAPGHLRTSPLPGQEGNSVILGHRSTHGAPFAHLDDLVAEDEITVVTGQGEQTFVVTGIRTAAADNAEVFEAGDEPTLTLVTSDSLLSDRRLIVEATLDGEPVPAPGGQPTSVGQEELGVRGTGAQIAGLFLWAQTLLLVAIGTVILYRRWRAWPSYLITTPVLAALVWLVFENVSTLLPATM